MGRIDWLPIAELPEAFKDGRRVLLCRDDEPPPNCGVVGWWAGGAWRDYGDIGCNGEYEYEPTHFAELNPPAE